MSDTDGPVPPHNLNVTIGAAFVGYLVALFVYGVTTGQVLLHLGRSFSAPWTRRHVMGVWILDTTHTVFLSVASFYYCVVFHSDPAHLPRVVSVYGAIAISAEASTSLVRFGYAYRIWKFNRRRALIPILIALLALLIFAMGLLYGIEESVTRTRVIDRFKWNFYVVLSANLAADITIAVSMLSLFRGFFTGVRRYDVIVQTLIFYVVNTGINSIILISLGLVMYILWPSTTLFISCYWIVSKMHACSFLAVVNAEKELVMRASAHATASPPMFTTALRVDDDHASLPDGGRTTELTTYSRSSFVLGVSLHFSEPTEIMEVTRKSQEPSTTAPSVAILRVV